MGVDEKDPDRWISGPTELTEPNGRKGSGDKGRMCTQRSLAQCRSFFHCGGNHVRRKKSARTSQRPVSIRHESHALS